MEAFEFEDGELGLLLDLDSGTLTAYKNGRRLGVMKDVSRMSWISMLFLLYIRATYGRFLLFFQGLSGEYCWTATIMAHYSPGYFGNEQSIRIKRGELLSAST